MYENHRPIAKKIKAKCSICGKKLEPRYTAMGEIYNWVHKEKKPEF